MVKQNLKSKIIVITGASSGIGREIALKFAEKGAVPLLIARSEDKLVSLKKAIYDRFQITARSYVLDVSRTEDVKTVFEQIFIHCERIDVLVNCAGFGVFDYFSEAKIEDIKKMFAVNAVGLMACTKMVVPHMIRRRSGHIVNIASIAGKLSTPKSTVYAATKHAVLGFSNGLRMELADKGISVMAVNPGPIRTPFFATADPGGNYAKRAGRFMLDPSFVARKVIEAIEKNKREVNLPWYMGTGTKFYQIFPRLVERAAGPWFKLK